MKKRVISLIMAAVLSTFSLMGCGGSESSDTSQNSETAEASQEKNKENEESGEADTKAESDTEDAKKVTALFFSLEADYFAVYNELFGKGLRDLGYEYESFSSDMDDLKMIEQIENAVAKGTDVLWIWPIEGKTVSDALKKAREEDVIVYCFVQDPGEGAADIVSGIDQVQCGIDIAELAIEWADETYGEDAEAGCINTIILHNEDSEDDKKKSDAMEATILEDDRFNVLESMVASTGTIDTQNLIENLFAKHPNIDCIILPVGSMVLGTCAYLSSEACTLEDPKAVGVFGSELDAELANYVYEGYLDGTIVTGGRIEDSAQMVVDQIDGLIKGTQETGFIGGPLEKCTLDNIDTFGY